MPTRISLIYDNPVDPVAFEGLQTMAAAKVLPEEDGTPTPAYRLLDLYFADYDTAELIP